MFVYKITNILNGKIYVGQTRQAIEKRFLQHSKANSPLGDAMRQCGLENFTIEVVETCGTPEQLRTREMFWIRVLKCKVPNGYNQTDGGESCSPKIRRSMSKFVPFARTTSKMTLGESLRRFRGAYRLSQKQVAHAGKVSCQSYQTYEYDKSLPSVKVITNIADAYNVSADYLLGRSDAPNPTEYDEDEVRKSIAFRRSWLEAQRTKDAAQRAQAEFENQVKLLTQ